MAPVSSSRAAFPRKKPIIQSAAALWRLSAASLAPITLALIGALLGALGVSSDFNPAAQGAWCSSPFSRCVIFQVGATPYDKVRSIPRLGSIAPLDLVGACGFDVLGRAFHRDQPLQRREPIRNSAVRVLPVDSRARTDGCGDDRPRQHRLSIPLRHHAQRLCCPADRSWPRRQPSMGVLCARRLECVGLLQRVLVIRLQIPAIIATLGTGYVLATATSSSEPLNSQASAVIPPFLNWWRPGNLRHADYAPHLHRFDRRQRSYILRENGLRADVERSRPKLRRRADSLRSPLIA